MATTTTSTHDEFDAARAEFGEPLHNRDYRVEVYRAAPDMLRLVGRIRDENPNGLTDDDDEPIDLHDMTVVMDVKLPDLTIVDCRPAMHMHPHDECPTILETYRQVVGLSIARGFTHAVRERLGGPRGCTHITMLIQAMAPVAWQGLFAFHDMEIPEPGTPEFQHFQKMAVTFNRNSCHMFSEGGIMDQRLEEGVFQPPIWARDRARRLGLDWSKYETDGDVGLRG